MIKMASTSWTTLPSSTAREYSGAAKMDIRSARRKLDEEIASTELQIVERKEEISKRDAAIGCRCSKKDAEMSLAEKFAAQEMYTGTEFREDAHITDLRKRASEGVELPDADSCIAVMAMPCAEDARQDRPVPWWVPPVSHLRRHFQSCIFLMTTVAGPARSFFYSYAMQNPREVTLLALEEIEGGVDLPVMNFLSGNASACLWYPHVYQASGARWSFLHESDDFAHTVASVDIVADVRHDRDDFFYARLEPVPLGAWCLQFPDVPRSACKHTPRGSKLVLSKMKRGFADLFSWYRQHLVGNSGGARSDAKRRRKDPSRTLKEPEPLDEETLRDAHAHVENLREKWRDAHADEEDAIQHFRVEHRGGRWTRRHRNVPCDVVRGIFCTQAGRRFCDMWKLKSQFNMSVGCYGGVRNCEHLAHAWCVRMSFFYSLWPRAGSSADLSFSAEDSAEFREDEDLTAAALGWAAGSQCCKRLRELRRIAP